MKTLSCLFLIGLLTGCAHTPLPDNAVSVDELIDQQRMFEGKRVMVYGWITDCYSLSCGLLSERKNMDSNYLSIGRSEKFDVSVQGYSGRQVTVEALFNRDCVKPSSKSDIIVACTDRPGTLSQPVFKYVHN